jgi:glycosyltransferase involved in cell wall biosynthesis
MQPQRISLIISTYNWPAALGLVLASVERQTLMPAQLVVADDGSGSETRAVVDAWRRKLSCEVVHLWQKDVGYRLARARNIAIASATGDYIVSIDGDMILHPKFIEDHAACARPDCFIQGARPRMSAALTQRLLDTGQPSVSIFSSGIEHRAYAFRSVLVSLWASKAKSALSAVQGCNQSFWRKHAVAVNGYDERFTAWGPEDREFAARLLHIGLKRNYVRHRAIALHLHHTTRAPDGYNPFDRLLSETLLTRAVWCNHGLDTHLARSHSTQHPTLVPQR